MSWEIKKLGDFVYIKTGKLDANASSIDGAYPFFTCSKEPLRINTYSYDCECVLVAGNGDLNVKYYQGKFDAYQRTYIVESQDNKLLWTRYLYYFLDTYLEKLREQSIGGVIKYIKLENLTDAKIPLPPLATQKRIAEILDAADALRRKDQELLKKYDELAQAIFIDMFGDPVKNEKGWDFGTIRDVATEVKYGTSKPAEEGGRYPYLRMNNITYEGDWDFKDLKYINLNESEKNKYLIKKGDLVFNRTNSKELVGKTAVYNQSQEMAIAGYLIRVRTNEKANSNYISAYLNSKHGKKTLLGMCKSIIGMANINAQELQDISIMIPPIELQNKFSQIVRQIEQLKIKIVTQKSFSENVFNSSIQKAFKGELVS